MMSRHGAPQQPLVSVPHPAPDAGQFTYQRTVPAHVARDVAGTIELGWCNRQRALDGKATIKISLGTGDARLAHARWVEVHPQVDALVRLAELRARSRANADKHSAIHGVSTCAVDDLVKAMGGTGVSKSQVSRHPG